MASTLYIQLPSRAMADATEFWEKENFSFCLASAEKNILQQGRDSLARLAELAAGAHQVNLLLAPSDVNFLKIKVPPMPFAKLKLALPNLLEEQLLNDVADLAFFPMVPVDQECELAVVSQSWLSRVFQVAAILNARRLSAFPLTLGLQAQDDTCVVLCEKGEKNPNSDDNYEQIELALKTQGAPAQALSLRVAQSTLLPETVMNTVSLLSASKKIQLLVDAASRASFEAYAQTQTGFEIEVKTSDWRAKIAGVFHANFDVLASISQSGKASFDWPRWRWTVLLGSLILMLALGALNWRWWVMHREYRGLDSAIAATYKSHFPNESIGREPLLLIQQKINRSKKYVGQSSNDDFLVMSAQFGMVMDQVLGVQAASRLETVEYRDHTLFIKPKNFSEFPLDRFRNALKERSLSLESKDGVLVVTPEVGGVK